jgi:hypothetical protein
MSAMEYFMAFWLLVLVKTPLLWVGWYIYKAVTDVPEQVLGEDDGGDPVRVTYGQGPRTRGPRGGLPIAARAPRRGDAGHDESATERPREPVGTPGE